MELEELLYDNLSLATTFSRTNEQLKITGDGEYSLLLSLSDNNNYFLSQNIEVIPQNPNSDDIIKLVHNVNYIPSDSIHIAANKIYVSRFINTGIMGSVNGSEDTITIGKLSQGTYTIDFEIEKYFYMYDYTSTYNGTLEFQVK